MTRSAEDTIGTALGWSGDVVSFREGGVTVAVWVRVDAAEHARRRGGGAILEKRAVGALHSLQLDVATPRASIRSHHARALRRVSHIAVDHVDGHVRRRARQPLVIEGCAVLRRGWDVAADALGAFATVCARIAAVTRVDDRVLAEAAMWGIGVMTPAGETIAAPADTSNETGPYQWWLAERAYGAWLERVTTSPTR